MDDVPEERAPKAKPTTGKESLRKSTAEAPAAKTKARSGSAKPAAARKSKQPAAPTEAKPAPKRVRAPAKAKQAGQLPVSSPAELPPAAEVLAHVEAPVSELPPLAPVEQALAEPQSEGPAGDVTIHPVEPHVPSVHPHDAGLEFGLSPVDLAPDASVREEAGLGWFIRILALSSVLLVLFNSFAIDKWAREQPVTRLNSQVLIAAHQFHAEMQSFHLDAPLEGMRSVWHGIREAKWPGSADSGEKAGAANPPVK